MGKSLIEKIRKEQIIELAIDVISEKGYINASIGEIAKLGNMSKGVITYYFKSKDDLINSAIKTILLNVRAYVIERVNRVEPYSCKLIEYLHATLGYWRENRRYYKAIIDLWSSMGLDESKREHILRTMRVNHDYIHSIIRGGVENGELKPVDSDQLAWILQSSMEGFLFYYSFNPEFINLDDIERFLVELVGWSIVEPKTTGKKKQPSKKPKSR